MQLNDQQYESLKSIISYLVFEHEEVSHYAQMMSDNADTSNHIYHHIKTLNDAMGDDALDLSSILD